MARMGWRGVCARLVMGTIAVAAGFAPNASAAVGDLDAGFASGGKLSVPVGLVGYEYGRAVAIQPDGKIVVGVETAGAGIAVARYNPDGTPDLGFGGGDGFVETAVGWSVLDVLVLADGSIVASSGLAAVHLSAAGIVQSSYDRSESPLPSGIEGFDVITTPELQPDGSSVVAGTAYSDEEDLGAVVVRLEADGDYDLSFSGDGIAPVAVADDFMPAGVTRQADGNLVIVGSTDGDFVAARILPGGTPDSAFGDDGVATTDLGTGSDAATSVAIQPDGMLVVAGKSGADFGVVRYESDGDPDATFSGDGRLTTDFAQIGQSDAAADVEIQPNGAIVVAGEADAGYQDYDYAVARYEPDGDLDATFSGDGMQRVDLTADADHIQAIALAPGGALVAVGWSRDPRSARYDVDLSLVRFASDGDLDASFSGDGKLLPLVPTTAAASAGEGRAVALQPDGKVVVAGTTSSEGGSDFAVGRMLADGTPDPAFGGGDGYVTTDFGGDRDEAYGVAVQPDGAIVVVGSSHPAGSPYRPFLNRQFAVARYQPDGDPDPSFSGDGRLTTQIGLGSFGDAVATAVLVSPSGGIVVAGTGDGASVVRYKADGQLDGSFSGDGKAQLPSFAGGYDGRVSAAFAPGGAIVVAGTSYVSGTNNDFAVARLEADGDPDPTFAGDGTTTVDFSGAYDYGNAVAVQPDGAVVLAGLAPSAPGGSGTVNDVAIARLEADGDPDPTFSGDGRVTSDLRGGYDSAAGVAIDDQGAILVAAATDPAEDAEAGNRDLALLRYTPAGALDPAFSGDGTAITDVGHHETASALALSGAARAYVVGTGGASGGDVQIVAYTLTGDPALADVTPPDTTITAGPSDLTAPASAVFRFSSSEAGSRFECRVFPGAFAPCTSPHTLATLTPGDYLFEVRAIDPAHNVDASPAQRGFTVRRAASPPPTGGAGPAPDTIAPRAALGGAKVQKAKGKVIVAVSCSEACDAKVSGVVALGGGKKLKLRARTAKVAPGVKASVAIKLPRKTLAAIKRLLRRGAKPVARLTVAVTDAAGNTRSARRTVRLRL